MLTFGNPLVKAIFNAKIKLQSCLDMISSRINASVFPDIQETAEDSSTNLLCLLNLIFLVSLVLLSPDRLSQVLSSARPSWLAFDWIQDVVEALGKMVPF
jgi:hypothetical protein